MRHLIVLVNLVFAAAAFADDMPAAPAVAAPSGPDYTDCTRIPTRS
jgi:hypothetical protein